LSVGLARNTAGLRPVVDGAPAGTARPSFAVRAHVAGGDATAAVRG